MCLVGSLIASLGCDRDPLIRVYEVEVRKPNPQNTASNSDSSATTPKRMLGAVIPAGERSIFLKMTGSPDELESYLEPLKQLAATTKLVGDEVEVKLPEGWSKGPGTAIAAFTLVPPSMAGVDAAMTVTVLPGATELNEWKSYVQQNLDRWRGQLGLPSVALDEDLQDSVQVIAVEGFDLPGYVVNYVGQSSGKPSMPPFAGGAMMNSGASPGSAPPSAPIAPSSSSTSEEQVKVKYELPEGWVDQSGKGSPIRLATILTGTETNSAEVSVVMAGGEEKTIVELWAQSILPPEEAGEEFVQQVISTAKAVKTSKGVDGKLYRIFPKSEDTAQANAILVAVFPVDGSEGQRSLFAKLTGQVQVASDNESKFEAFVQSLNWQ